MNNKSNGRFRTTTGLFTLISRYSGVIGSIVGILFAFQAQAQHTLIAHYAFDTTDTNNDIVGTDSSGNGNDITFGASANGGGVFVTSNAAAGPLAIDFSLGPDNNGFGVLSWSPAPANLLSTLAGSFTVSCWIQTTQSVGSPGDAAYQDAGIIAADVPGGAYDVTPIGLTGGAIAFTTGEGSSNPDDTLTSMNQNVNDGNYHLITVTRDQNTGLKTIYIDGQFDSSAYGVTHSLSDPQQIDIGCVGNGSDPSPNDGGFYNPYSGNFDDLQIYSGVLDANEVAYLYQNPGMTASNTMSPPPPALHTLIAHYAFDTTDDNNDAVGSDTSGNGYDMTFGAGGGGGGVISTADAAAGPLAAQFTGDPNSGAYGVLSWATSPTNILAALAGSFTVSCWIQTTQDVGSPGDPAWADVGIVAADVPGGAYDAVPIGLTGGAIAFTTGEGPEGNDDTVTSMDDSVNDGNYHLVTITRDQTTGLKIIYIDGQYDNAGYGTTTSLSDPQQLDVGCVGDGGDPNPNDFGFYNGYDGNLDDLQIYSGVLNPSEVAYLYQNPGLTASNTSTPPPPAPIPNLVAHYAFDDPNNIGFDSSGRSNNLDVNSTAPGGNGVVFNATAEAGPGAAFFDGGSFLTYSNLPAEIRDTFASSFTLSVWISTTTTSGSDGDSAWEDAGIVAADIPGTANDIVPMSLTGSGIGFGTGGPNFDDDLSSYANVADGNYHHVVVTRDQATGAKQIYVDGVLSANDTGAIQYLHDPVEIAVGTEIDASQTDPNEAYANAASQAVYQGLMDDMQLYNRVLGSNEVAWLYQNPGMVITSAPPPAVDASVAFFVYFEEDPLNGNYYLIFPDVDVNNPAQAGTVTLFSPNNYFGSGGSGAISPLSSVIDEVTNGYWTFAINAGCANEQIFHFQASVTDLTSNTTPLVQILVPAFGAINVPTNTPFQWAGPTNFDFINVSVESDNYTQQFFDSFDATATNWPSPPAILPGTNRFDVVYASNNYSGFATTTPVDTLQTPVDSWGTNDASLNVEKVNQFIAVGGSPTPVTLVGISRVAAGLQFSFTSQAGTLNTLQSSTNLAHMTNWVTVTNFPGDGNVWQFVLPTTNQPEQFFRVETQSQ